jgi:hypothetical protein
MALLEAVVKNLREANEILSRRRTRKKGNAYAMEG